MIDLAGYKFEFEKKEFCITKWSKPDFKYICKINIYNNLNLLLLSLVLNESDIVSICSLIYDFLEFGQYEGYIPLSYHDTNMCSYTLHITSEYNAMSEFYDASTTVKADKDKQYIIIREYNPLQQRIIDRIILEFKEYSNFDLFSFMELLYTNFLYDPNSSLYSYIGDYLYGG